MGAAPAVGHLPSAEQEQLYTHSPGTSRAGRAHSAAQPLRQVTTVGSRCQFHCRCRCVFAWSEACRGEGQGSSYALLRRLQ